MSKINFPAILRYVPACQEWRLIDINGKDTTQEFRLQSCGFMNKNIAPNLNKNKDNPVMITIQVKNNAWLKIVRAVKSFSHANRKA